MPLCTTKLLLDKSIEIELLQFMWFYDRLHRLNREATFFSRGQRMLQICWLSLIRNINRNQRYTNQSTPATSCKLTTWHGKKKDAHSQCFWITNKLKKCWKLRIFEWCEKSACFLQIFRKIGKWNFWMGKLVELVARALMNFCLLFKLLRLFKSAFRHPFVTPTENLIYLNIFPNEFRQSHGLR